MTAGMLLTASGIRLAVKRFVILNLRFPVCQILTPETVLQLLCCGMS
jgi:hypothetical protein